LELCIGLATARHPSGPFTAYPYPILKNNVIDPHVYVEGESAYLYWKEDNNDAWPMLLLEFLQMHPRFITALFDDIPDQKTAALMLALFPWLQQLPPMERFQLVQVFIEAVTNRYFTFKERLQAIIIHLPPGDQQRVQNILAMMQTPMYARQLSADGTLLTGVKTLVIQNDQPWEAHLVEGMWLWKQGDFYYLFYAGNDFSTEQYGIGVAVSKSPLGPYN